MPRDRRAGRDRAEVFPHLGMTGTLAPYGLPELWRTDLAGARLVASPEHAAVG